MSNISKKYLEEALVDAKQKSELFVANADVLIESYLEKNKFYVELKLKDYLWMILSLVLGIVGFVYLFNVLSMIPELPAEGATGYVIIRYLITVYVVGCIGLIVNGIWKGYLVGYSVRAKSGLSEMRRWRESLRSKVLALDDTYVEMEQNLFENPSAISFAEAYYNQSKIQLYASRLQDVEVDTGSKKILFKAVVFGVLTLVHFVFLGILSAGGIAVAFTYETVLAVCATYMMLMLLLYKFQVHMYDYLQMHTKKITLICFLVYQIAMAIALYSNGAFMSSDSPLVQMIIEAMKIEEFNPFSRGMILMLITTFVGFFYVRSINIERERKAMADGVEAQNTDGTRKTFTPKEIKAGEVPAMVFLSIFCMVASFGMSFVWGEFWSLIIPFVVVGIIWAVLSYALVLPEKVAAYGSKHKWVVVGFFFCYLFLSLTFFEVLAVAAVVPILIQCGLGLLLTISA